MEKEKSLNCEHCQAVYQITYDPSDGEPETCPFCGAGVGDTEEPDDIEEDTEEDE